MRTVLTVGGRMPLPEEATALQLGPGSPLLVLWRVTYDREAIGRSRRPGICSTPAGGGHRPLADRRGPLAGTADPGPRRNYRGQGRSGTRSHAVHDLSDDG